MGDISEMLDQRGLIVERKFIEQFANGLRVYSTVKLFAGLCHSMRFFADHQTLRRLG